MAIPYDPKVGVPRTALVPAGTWTKQHPDGVTTHTVLSLYVEDKYHASFLYEWQARAAEESILKHARGMHEAYRLRKG
jgi:hypothetical protein